MTDAKIKVLYFAQVAELLDKREELWPARSDLTVEKLLDELCSHYSVLEPLKERLQVAINHYHAQPGDPVAANDEVAVFEPVTGG
ncbi:MAG TPA: MoaD/ThiS family protein [Paenalcaligenes sp.]|nr:MoaD/ThiS family protein [Paenalcaligenes sp.]